MRWLAVAMYLVSIGCMPAAAQQPPSAALTWRVENPFRFFKRPEDTALVRDAYVALKRELRRAPSIQDVERKLALETEGWGWAERVHGDNVLDRVVQEPCWYQAHPRCSDYVRPKSHRVVVSVSGVRGMCAWRQNGQSIAAGPQNCADPITLDIPFPQGAQVAAYADGALAAETKVVVRDLLVVSLGDSFGSGEGNPDQAVRFDNHRIVNYDVKEWDLQGYPPRAGTWSGTSDPVFRASAARWLHRPCHRSLYSQHVRLALHLAVSDEDGHQAVTFLGVACTSGEIIKGLFAPNRGSDQATTADAVTLSQLSGISRALCAGAPVEPSRTRFDLLAFAARQPGGVRAVRPQVDVCPADKARPIDLVLLSVGGNDSGFSRLVARAAIRNDAVLDTLAQLKGEKYKIDLNEARARAKLLKHNYAMVNLALRTVLHVTDSRRVLFTAYPPMAFDGAGRLCPSGRQGMDVSPMYELQAGKAAEAEAFVAGELLKAMQEAAATHGWSWVESHRQVFKSHGVCAAGGETLDVAATEFGLPRRRGPKPPIVAFTGRTRSTMIAPRPAAGRREAVPNPKEWKWQPYEPDKYRPYWPRARWFRTPNDAFMTVNLHESSPGDIINVTRFSAYSGAFHPTAQGHAAIADAVLRKIIENKLLDAR